MEESTMEQQQQQAQQQLMGNEADDDGARKLKALEEEAAKSSLKLESLTEGQNEGGIPAVKFIEDIDTFSNGFTPPASAELLIGAYSDLFARYKKIEENLNRKRVRFLQKIPEIEKSLALVQYLKSKQDVSVETPVVTRYSLSETIFATSELDCNGTVNLWLGANVMLEYTYDDAIQLLSSKETNAKKEYQSVLEDLAFCRNQIITSEVNISRVYNWDVRIKRAKKALLG